MTVSHSSRLSTSLVHAHLVSGNVAAALDPLVRLRRACLAGDVFGKPDCIRRRNRSAARRRTISEVCRVFVYLRADDPVNNSISPSLGHSAPPVAGLALSAQVIAEFGARQICLCSNSTTRCRELGAFGLQIVEHGSIDLSPPPDDGE